MSAPPPLPPYQRGLRGARHQHPQVSLRGASAREISRDDLLQKVSQERELRNYTRRASAAALSIQRVWRRHYTMKQVAGQLQEEWEASVNHPNIVKTTGWISNILLRPFLFFTAQLRSLGPRIPLKDAKCLTVCFETLCQSINSSDSGKNLCSLAVGTSCEKSTWLYQAKKLVSLCAFLLSECDPTCHEGQDMVRVTALGMHLIISLTDPVGWKVNNNENTEDSCNLVKRLVRYMATGSCMYSSIRKYILKLVGRTTNKNIIAGDDEHFLIIITSAISLTLRPFHAKKLGIDDISDLEVKDAAEEYYTSILTIPYLLQRLPPILLPALRHESCMLPCLKVQLMSKEKIFAKMLKLDESSESSIMGGISSVGWALVNIINLSTESTYDASDSGQFTHGLDFQLYVDVICRLSENFLNWLENIGGLRKNENGELNSATDSSIEEVHSGAEAKPQPFEAFHMFTNQLKHIHQQWHLRELLAVTKKNVLFQGADISTSTRERKLKLFDVVLFYSYMLRIFRLLDPLVGTLPILNMLSFTPGFLVLLWKELEDYVSDGNVRDTNDTDLYKGDPSQGKNEIMLEKKQKWVHVFQKITGKSSDVEYSDSRHEQIRPRQIVDDAFDMWEIEPFMHGPQGVSKDLSALLHLFCAAYAHLLLVLDDIEFYEKQVPFTLQQQLKISAVLNTFVYYSFIHSGQNNKSLMDVAVRCLNLLHERDCRRRFCPTSLWIGPARKGRLPIAAAARAHEAAFANLRSGDATSTHMSSIITTMPHVFPFEERVQMFREFIKLDKVSRRAAGEVDGLGSGSIEIVVRRDHIIEDGFRQLNSLGSRLKSSFNVSFVSECGLPEVGLDYGGLSKEFLTDLSRSAFNPEYGLFIQTSTSERLLIPNVSARFLENGLEMIEFLGRVVGKALYEGILLDYSFSLSFVQKLMGRYSFLDELSTLDPELYKNLMYVKHYDGDVKDLSLDFTVTEEICGKRVTTELKPGGKNMLVTNDNKLQYVYAMSDCKLNRQILPLANAFFRGLSDLISSSWLRLFNANEFNQLLSGGKHDFDVEDLKSNTKYTGGYSEGSRTVKLFWEVVKGFTSNERCMLLKFVTSCSRAPLLGFKYLQPSFTIHKVACDMPLWAMIGGQDVDRLPSASTCYNTLKLPTYKRPSTLRCKLLYAVCSNADSESFEMLSNTSCVWIVKSTAGPFEKLDLT